MRSTSEVRRNRVNTPQHKTILKVNTLQHKTILKVSMNTLQYKTILTVNILQHMPFLRYELFSITSLGKHSSAKLQALHHKADTPQHKTILREQTL